MSHDAVVPNLCLVSFSVGLNYNEQNEKGRQMALVLFRNGKKYFDVYGASGFCISLKEMEMDC